MIAAPDSEVDEQSAHVGHGVVGGVARGLVGALRLAVAPHVPGDHAPAIGEGPPLAVPHAPGGAEAVRQEQRGPLAADVVVQAGPVDRRGGHR